jgi:uncharacterized tellurite resistance protein B-like protein
MDRAMRQYPRNSPEAAGRLLALALMADGQVSPVELSRLEDLMAHTRLGLRRPVWLHVLHDFCAELASLRRRSQAAAGAGNGTAAGDLATELLRSLLSQFLAEVDDPRLRETVLTLCLEAIDADRVVTHGESEVIEAVFSRWGLPDRTTTPVAA